MAQPDNIFAELGMPFPEDCLLRGTLVSRIRAVVEDRALTREKVGRITGLSDADVAELLDGGAVRLADRLCHVLNLLGVSVRVSFDEMPAHVAGETTCAWDRVPVPPA